MNNTIKTEGLEKRIKEIDTLLNLEKEREIRNEQSYVKQNQINIQNVINELKNRDSYFNQLSIEGSFDKEWLIKEEDIDMFKFIFSLKDVEGYSDNFRLSFKVNYGILETTNTGYGISNYDENKKEEYNNRFKNVALYGEMMFRCITFFQHPENIKAISEAIKMYKAYDREDHQFNVYELRKERQEIELWLKEINLNLQVGDVIEICNATDKLYYKAKDGWEKVKILKITPKRLEVVQMLIMNDGTEKEATYPFTIAKNISYIRTIEEGERIRTEKVNKNKAC